MSITHEDLELINSNPDAPDISVADTGIELYIQFMNAEKKPRIVKFPESLLKLEPNNIITNKQLAEKEKNPEIGLNEKSPIVVNEISCEDFVMLINFMAYPHAESEEKARLYYKIILALNFSRHANMLKIILIDYNNVKALENKETKVQTSEYVISYNENKIELYELFNEALTKQHFRVANWCVSKKDNLNINNVKIDEINCQYLKYTAAKYNLIFLLKYLLLNYTLYDLKNKKEYLQFKTQTKKLYLVAVRNDNTAAFNCLREDDKTGPEFNKNKLVFLDVAYGYKCIKMLSYLLNIKNIASKAQLEALLNDAREKHLFVIADIIQGCSMLKETV